MRQSALLPLPGLHRSLLLTVFLSAAWLLPAPRAGEAPVPNLLPLGGPAWEGWTGLVADAEGAARPAGSTASFRYPQGPKGWYRHGFVREHDGTRDWRPYLGLQLQVEVPAGTQAVLRVTVQRPELGDRPEFAPAARAEIVVNGAAGWQTLVLPWSIFDCPPTHTTFYKFVTGIDLQFDEPVAKPARLRQVRLVRSNGLVLTAPFRGQAVAAGAEASYAVTVGNCTDLPHTVVLKLVPSAYAVMPATIVPDRLELAPGASASCTVRVRLPAAGVPPGGHERQVIQAVAMGDALLPAQLELVTARALGGPSLIHTEAEWQEVRDKVAKYDWAKQTLAACVGKAEGWKVPQAASPEEHARAPERHPYVFMNNQFDILYPVTTAWLVTGNRAYGEKLALFLRRLADEQTGYPAILAGTSMGEPQEGGNFQNVAIAYDAIRDSGLLSPADQAAIARTLRLFQDEFADLALGQGNVGNWSTAAAVGALMGAFALGDLAAADKYLYGPCGFTDYVTKGIMDDGWWWECSTGYNFWVASELTQSALAARPWGIDLLHREFPVNLSPNTITTPWGLNPAMGMSFEKWGPVTRNTRSIKQLWDAIPPVADYRGIAFGTNDGHEESVLDARLELAYYAFRDPRYAALIKLGSKRDLVYGVPELPEQNSTPWLNSAYAENIGYALLRSQTPQRPPREQIAAVFKIGSQGGYHGHFDRVSLDALMRYGRNFWNPESVWYGYGNYMYKFYVQTSVSHNMVVVDQQQQEAVPSRQLLFHSGPALQVVAHETKARWSDPPYGGMVYQPGQTVTDMMRANRQSLPVVADRRLGDLGPFSEPVLQRRLGIVTDDYVVIADYLRGERPHTFDNLLQTKEFAGLEAPAKELLRHTGQYGEDPRRAAQFVTDCDWYRATAPSVAHFVHRYGPGADNAGTRVTHMEDGVLKLDVHTLWPVQQELMLGMPPETHKGNQWVTYEVSGDGKSLARGESGIWILGAVDIDVPVAGVQQLVLTTTSEDVSRKSLFWSRARVVLADGREEAITGTPEGISQPAKPGLDYYGGPIKIMGQPDARALPAQPAANGKPGCLTLSLAGRDAVRFKATLGGDYPFGDETQRRRVFASRVQGTSARFLTVIEPCEDRAAIRRAVADSADHLRVTLVDGREQELTIAGLEGGDSNLVVTLREFKDGKEWRRETTAPAARP